MITHYRFLPPTISPTEEEIKNAHNQALNTLRLALHFRG